MNADLCESKLVIAEMPVLGLDPSGKRAQLFVFTKLMFVYV